MENIIKSVSYIEFLNKVTSISNELLYNSKDGFMMQKSKDGVLGYSDKLKKFEYELSKIAQDTDFSNADDVIKKRKEIFSLALINHAKEQLSVWIDEVFQDFIENSMFEVSINKKNADFEKNNILSVLTWFCKVKNYDEESYEKMLNELNIRFKRVLNSSDNDYLPKTAANKTNENEFLKLWDMILENQDEFLNYDLDSKINLLSDEDIKYFQNVKNKIQTYKKNSIKDEIILINSSMKIAKITENSKKYDFIKQILNDFCLFYEQNKLLEEKDKIEIIKRRLHLFLNKETKTSSYFEKLFSL